MAVKSFCTGISIQARTMILEDKGIAPQSGPILKSVLTQWCLASSKLLPVTNTPMGHYETMLLVFLEFGGEKENIVSEARFITHLNYKRMVNYFILTKLDFS